MKKQILTMVALLLGVVAGLQAQDFSQFSVKYMVTYDESKASFTAWVVPQYDTPNIHNGDSEEKGATAQFSLKVPKGFVMSNIQDVRGVWEKTPNKVGMQASLLKAGADGSFEYYVLGKAAVETNYGNFKSGEPVALFTFSGNGGSANQVSALESNDPFIKIADKTMSLNVGSSFYSRSGQRPTISATPLEQFAAPISINTVLKEAATKAGIVSSESAEMSADSKLIAYPNPAVDVLNVKYFSEKEGANVQIELVDVKGSSQISNISKAKLGFNTLQLNVSKLVTGSYIIKTTIDKLVLSKKVSKIE